MRLRTLSDQLEKEINIRFYAAIAMTLLSAGAAAIIFIYSRDGSYKEYATILLITIFLLFGFSLNCFAYWAKLLKARLLAKKFKRCPYVDISSQGILLETIDNDVTSEKLLTWDRLNAIKGHYIDIGFPKGKPKKCKIAIISDGRSMEIPKSMETAKTPRQFRRAIKNNQEFLEEQQRNFEPYNVLVEMYDEMAAEIKKYWKKKDQ